MPSEDGGMMRAITLLLVLFCLPGLAEEVALSGLKQPVEILRDRWGDRKSVV